MLKYFKLIYFTFWEVEESFNEMAVGILFYSVGLVVKLTEKIIKRITNKVKSYGMSIFVTPL